MALPPRSERVQRHTPGHVNERLSQRALEEVAALARTPGRIDARVDELKAEWDVERALEANAATLALIGTVFGFFLHPYWLAIPAIVAAFLLQHALQGWCPPLPILRRLGFRTPVEIEQERHALKALRGDYAGLDRDTPERVGKAFLAAGL